MEYDEETDEETEDQVADMNPQILDQMQTMVSRFLAENCSSRCLDNDEDREEVSGQLAHFLLDATKEMDLSPESLLPKAKYKLGFTVVDEPTGKTICRIQLNRQNDMTDGDFLQMQNFFWTTIGRAIAENPEIIRTLELAGIDVDLDPGDGGAQPAPAL